MTLEPLLGSTALYRANVSWKYIIGTHSPVRLTDPHQPPEVQYIEAFAEIDFTCRLNFESLDCRVNYRSEMGFNSSLQVAGG
jgi:hypothetical protein